MNTLVHLGDWTEVSHPDVLVRQPVVSVHMITFNHEAFLAEAVQGVLRQETRYPLELVIGEDCSKDNTREIALEYQRRFPKSIRVIFSETNVGMLPNSRRVFESCRGRYVAICEGDDYWHHPLKLQRQIDALEQDDGCTLIHSDFDIRAGSRLVKSSHRKEGLNIATGDVLEDLILHNHISTCTACLRMEIVKQYLVSPFAQKDYAMGDYPLWLFAARKGRLNYIDEALATYRRAAGSAIHGDVRALARILLDQGRVRKEFIAAFGCSEETRRSAQIINNLNAMMASALLGDQQRFCTEFEWFQQNNQQWRRSYKYRLRYLLIRCRLSWLLRFRYGMYLRSRLIGRC